MYKDKVMTTEEDETIIATLKVYYYRRDMPMPEDEKALAFFLSEVGELCNAYRLTHTVAKDFEKILVQFETLGIRADEWVSARGTWQRNGDRNKAPSVADEIADCLMMIYVFAFKSKITPFSALKDKMMRKLATIENQRN